MRNYKLGTLVLVMIGILILTVVGLGIYNWYDQTRVLSYEKVIEREYGSDVKFDDERITLWMYLPDGNLIYTGDETQELIETIIIGPANMKLQKTSGFTSRFRYRVSGTSAHLNLEATEREVGVGSDIYRVVGEDNQLLQAIEEIKDSVEWEEP
ncbi:hypothetical protein MKY91_19495 [Alkalicoccobacillus gibsonii]|uniref:DUF4367 domain-containing protein n=1 Tax=Alkalicoccobacillus gibsonii TaxID=79881 RepID=A0ABU9VN70_9BACI